MFFTRDLTGFVNLLGLNRTCNSLLPTNYITKERTLVKDGLAFAGVDSGRFPLMFDAMAAGIQAVKALFDE